MYRALALLAYFVCAGAQAESQQCTTIASVPVTISVPGSYCFTGDLASGSGTAISNQADNEEQDLNGTLRGVGNAVYIDDHSSPFSYGGVSSRHEVSDLRIEGAYTAISVVGAYSSIHHHPLMDSAQYCILTD